MLQYRGPINTGPREDLLVVPPRLFCKARGQEMTNRSPQRCQLWSEPSLWSVVFHHVEERLHQRSYSLDMSGCQCVYPCISGWEEIRWCNDRSFCFFGFVGLRCSGPIIWCLLSFHFSWSRSSFALIGVYQDHLLHPLSGDWLSLGHFKSSQCVGALWWRPSVFLSDWGGLLSVLHSIWSERSLLNLDYLLQGHALWELQPATCMFHVFISPWNPFFDFSLSILFD